MIIFTFKNATDWLSLISKQEITKQAVISPDTSRSLNIPLELPSDEMFTKAVNNTKGARITEDGLEVDVTRNQHPDQGEMASLRSGVFYQPSGSLALKRNPYSGNQGYGGTERITGTTLLRRPIFVKGATGGRAPELAFDLLKGKGAYHAMRNDVINIVYNLSESWGKPRRNTYEMIFELLEKHGGDLDLVDEIYAIRNTAKGNNFAYALQENIVANNVRNAGYDSVIGWSSKRDGTAYLSEIFDVREVFYPSQFAPEGQVHKTILVQQQL